MNLKNLVVAHRGCHNKYIPENSLLSFKKALIKNYPIELDVRLLKDKNIVVFHDKNLYRMTKINKNIEKCTYDEIKDLKLLDSNERIPLLKDVLKLIDDKVLLMIEIKSKKMEKYLDDLLKGFNNICISSFNIKIIYKMKMINTNYKVGLITMGRRNKYLSLAKFDFVAYPIYRINDKIKYDIPTFMWGITNKEEVIKLKKSADSFIVDYL